MNILNFALGGLTGGLTNSPLTALTGIGGALLIGNSAHTNPSAASAPARDSLISDLPDIVTAVNGLQQAAGSLTSTASTSTAASSNEPELTIPPLPPMPTPQKHADVPTDDHGQSNVVFSDTDADGALIH